MPFIQKCGEKDRQQCVLGESNNGSFSLILLDLLMPVMDGYEFLERIAKDKRLSSIPVIVTTVKDCEEDEILSLEKGAVDFLSKPFHPAIVKTRVIRIIQFQETSAVLNAVEKDRLTGLCSMESFYLEVEHILEKEPDESYDMVVSDVENFKLINDRNGVEKGCFIAAGRDGSGTAPSECGDQIRNLRECKKEHSAFWNV